MTTTFKIAQLERHLSDGVVMTAHWTATKTDGDYTASAYGSLGLPPKDPTDPTFVPYEQLTEAQVIDWVKEIMGTEQVEALGNNLNSQIEAQKHPVKAAGMPWTL
jgi:hypothetical protein